MMPPKSDTAYLAEEEGRLLLRIARDSLNLYVLTGERADLDAYPLTPNLQAPHGAFVTLRKQAELRGCIGYTASVEPLAEAVRDNAVNAATRDPRFPPVSPEELDAIRIEVSALRPGDTPGSPFIRVRDVAEILVGRDGLYLQHAGQRGGGLLLPQVPTEQGWDRDQFLDGICRKAGALPDAWNRPGVELYRFSADIFTEPEAH